MAKVYIAINQAVGITKFDYIYIYIYAQLVMLQKLLYQHVVKIIQF